MQVLLYILYSTLYSVTDKILSSKHEASTYVEAEILEFMNEDEATMSETDFFTLCCLIGQR